MEADLDLLKTGGRTRTASREMLANAHFPSHLRNPGAA